jgi:two-component system, NtrC family, response regulator AtoC
MNTDLSPCSERVGAAAAYGLEQPRPLGREMLEKDANVRSNNGETMTKASIAVVDDDRSMGTYLSHMLSGSYAVNVLTSGDQLLDQLRLGPLPSLILLDVVMPERDGLHVIEKIMNSGLNIPVIMLSGMSQVRTVVEAMKLGAYDFLLKPVDENILLIAIQNALESNLSKHDPALPHSTFKNPGEFPSANAKMARLTHIIRRVAPTDVPILLLGESGVGKEVMARYAHDCSGRGSKPFVKVNCAALPNDLLESELFGYERGAFTGALTDKSGKFEQANGGTLLLDEIGEMSPHLQAKLLHVLQDGNYSRLGGTKSVRVDARIIAATNINIAKAIADGTFREDLYFRLNVISIDVPPLRERQEDIAAFCDYFIAKYGKRYNSEVQELPAELLDCFLRYDWPGNIRQLENFIKRFLILPGRHSLLTEFMSPAAAVAIDEAAVTTQPLSLIDAGAVAADRAERELVQRVLEETGGNRKQAAKRMNICYKALLTRLKRWVPPVVPPEGPEAPLSKDHAA